MSREVKFRQAIFLNGKFHSFHYWGFIKNDNNFISPQCSNQEALKNSQEFTGLKDKNGVEIHEGEIFCYPNEFPSVPGSTPFLISEVAFKNGAFMIGNYFLSEYNEEGFSIGNIFENPELIEEGGTK